MLPIPVDRSGEPLLEAHLRRPAGEGAQLARVDPLAVDLTRRRALSADLGLDAAAGQPADERHHVANPVGLTAAGVEGLSPAVTAQQRPPDGQIGGCGVLYVEEVALGR